MSADIKPTEKSNKVVRRLIEYTVIGAACTYLGVKAFKKLSTP